MTQTYFEEMMQSFGCHAQSGHAFGTFKGVPFSGQLLEGRKTTHVLFRFVCQLPPKPVVRQLNKEKLPHLRWFSHMGEQDTHALEALYTPPSDFYAKSGIHRLLGVVAALYETAELSVPDICPLCGLAGCDACASLEDSYRPVHAACVAARLQVPDADAILPEKAGGRVLPGILGAILGALIAALPIWTFALNQGTIYWILYAFIPIFSGLCYRLLRGKANAPTAAFSVLTASLAAAFMLELIWFWLLLSAEYGQTVAFGISVQRYLSSHTLATSIKEMFVCLLALMAGYIATTILLRRYVEDAKIPARTVRGALFIKSTMMRNSDIPPSKPLAEETPEPQGRHNTR